MKEELKGSESVFKATKEQTPEENKSKKHLYVLESGACKFK
jgi:hypothetical protein